MTRMLTTFPSSASFGHPLSSVRLLAEGNTSCPHANQPRPSFQRRPAKGAAFQKIGMSFTVTTYEGVLFARIKRLPSLHGLRTDSPAHAARTSSSLEDSCIFDEHCECHGAVTRSIRDCSRVQMPF